MHKENKLFLSKAKQYKWKILCRIWIPKVGTNVINLYKQSNISTGIPLLLPGLPGLQCMLKFMLVYKDFQTCLLIGLQHSHHPVRSHVRNYLQSYMDFDMIFLVNQGNPSHK